MLTGLEGRKALITGGGSGIGRAIAMALAVEGVDIVIAGRRPRPMVTGELRARGVAAHDITTDVSEEAPVEAMVERAAALLSGLDLYVNVAAGTWHEGLTELTQASWDATIATNVRACVIGCREVARIFIAQRRGSILIIGSTAVFTAQPGETSYRASKAALKAHMEVAAVELAPFGIRVNMLTPGAVDTELVAGASPDQRRAVVNAVPLRREATPEEMAPAALFLLSDRLASYVTGTDLVIDGGLHLRPIIA
jgi:3-oxoacyl-[acyl-carrier protein] reductase